MEVYGETFPGCRFGHCGQTLTHSALYVYETVNRPAYKPHVALIVSVVLHKHLVFPPLPALSWRLWMAWIINSVVVVQLHRDQCDVIFMSSSLICCWMSARGEPQLVGGFIYCLSEQLKTAVKPQPASTPPPNIHLLSSHCNLKQYYFTLCCLHVREDWWWAPEQIKTITVMFEMGFKPISQKV